MTNGTNFSTNKPSGDSLQEISFNVEKMESNDISEVEVIVQTSNPVCEQDNRQECLVKIWEQDQESSTEISSKTKIQTMKHRSTKDIFCAKFKIPKNAESKFTKTQDVKLKLSKEEVSKHQKLTCFYILTSFLSALSIFGLIMFISLVFKKFSG